MLNRFDGNVVPFASEATLTNRTVFGAETQSDDIDDNLNADFKKGWEIVGLNDNPTREDFNAMGYTLGNLISYLYQSGVAEYNALQEYKTNSIAIATDGSIYQSLVDDNIGNALTDATKWICIASKNSIVNSIDELKTISNIEAVNALGYYTKGDDGGGLFYWDSTSTDADNGGTIIQATGVTTGRWKRAFSGAVNVKWFGASTSIANNKSYIDSAIDYCYSIGGGTVYIPSGIFKIGGALSRLTDGIRLKNNVNIIGDGNSSVIRLDSTCIIGFHCRTLTAITNINDALNNVNISNIRIERPNSVWNDSYENTGLIELASTNNVIIEKCSFIGWPGDAILIGINNNATLSAALDTIVANVKIRDNYFDGITKDNRQAISFLDGYNIDIYNNYFTRTTRSAGYAMPGAIDFEPINENAIINNVNIYNNTFDDIGGATGVITIALGHTLVTAAHNINISKNIFKNITNTSDVFINGKTSESHTSVASGSPYNINVNNNIHTSTSASKKYISGGVSDLVIEENVIEGGDKFGLFGYINGVSIVPINGLYIRRNKVKNLTFAGGQDEGIVYFANGIINGTFDSNVFVDCGNLNQSTLLPQNMNILQITGNGCVSKNISISNNKIINTGIFPETAFPLHAATLTNPTTFVVKNNDFIGLNSYAYNGVESIYSQVPCDTYNGIVSMPDTTTPIVSGASSILITTYSATTNFLHGKNGQVINVFVANNSIIITNNSNIKLSGGVNFAMNTTYSLTLINRAGVWYEISRSVN